VDIPREFLTTHQLVTSNYNSRHPKIHSSTHPLRSWLHLRSEFESRTQRAEFQDYPVFSSRIIPTSSLYILEQIDLSQILSTHFVHHGKLVLHASPTISIVLRCFRWGLGLGFVMSMRLVLLCDDDQVTVCFRKASSHPRIASSPLNGLF